METKEKTEKTNVEKNEGAMRFLAVAGGVALLAGAADMLCDGFNNVAQGVDTLRSGDEL